jgi:polyphosphate kinase 2 (PPK2 family)
VEADRRGLAQPERRPKYAEAIEVMFERTGTDTAPWHAIEAESKQYARVKIVETVIAEIEGGMRERGFPVPG